MRQSAKGRRELETAERAAQEAAFASSLLIKTFALMAWAHKLGVSTFAEFDGDEHTPLWSVKFTFPERDSKFTDLRCHSECLELKWNSVQWDYTVVVNALQEQETFTLKDQEGLELARQAWDSLTEQQRKALGVSKYRP